MLYVTSPDVAKVTWPDGYNSVVMVTTTGTNDRRKVRSIAESYCKVGVAVY